MGKPIQAGDEILSTGLAAALGQWSNVSSSHKYGRVSTATTAFETVWEQTGAVTFPTTAAVVGIPVASQDASNDGVEITVEGLDENYAEQSVTLTLDADGDATSTETFLRVNRAFVSGSTALAADVDIEIGSTTVAHVDADHQQTLQCIYTVPAGKKAYLTRLHASTGTKNKQAEIRVYARESGGVFRTREIFGLFQASVQKDYEVPITFGEKTDIQIQVKSESSGSVITAAFDIINVG